MKGFIFLSRPVNVIIAMASIFLAAYISGGIEVWLPVTIACLSGGTITAGANAINDYFDLDIDRINKPDRPIPAGIISLKSAWNFSVICFFLGISSSLFINRYAFAICLSISLLLYFYSSKLKQTVLFGNFAVSISTGFAFVYGGIASGHVKNAIIPAIFAFLMHLGREIIKDMEDVEGDRINNATTLPVKHGLLPAQWLATFVFFVLFISTFIPYYYNIYGKWYLFIVVLGVNSVLFYSTILIWRKPNKDIFRTISAILKADMLVGLLAIYVGNFNI